mmetsp:Transcript_21468/g.36819  ORF Transcript_21468/g.36819 Transcript_21468/m.36819 type:complete len:81 (+) Transcript_21468:580-822(+)
MSRYALPNTRLDDSHLRVSWCASSVHIKKHLHFKLDTKASLGEHLCQSANGIASEFKKDPDDKGVTRGFDGKIGSYPSWK